MNWLLVFIGGGLGSMMRYGVSRLLLALELRTVFPWATLSANVLSAGLLAWWAWRQPFTPTAQPAWHLFLVVGVCGGFSTFSTFSQENFLLIRDGHAWMAIANIAVNVLACLAVVFSIAKPLPA